MLSSIQWELRRPKDDTLFEQMTRDLFAAHWKDPNTQINGRPGQKQDGVDVYGRPHQSELYFGIQCKLREEGNLTRKNLEQEIKQARSFRHQLDTYIFVTTLPRDTTLQAIVEELNAAGVRSGSFKVQIRFWEDICSLLDEHPRLIDKYYGKGGQPEKLFYQPLEEHPSEITSSSPFLVGIVLDLSRSMLELFNNMPKHSGISQKKLNETINILVEKAVAFCKTPEADDILPRFALFVYGYGFGKLRQAVTGILRRIGIRSRRLVPDLIPTDAVRDLFAEVASRESLPFTPDALDLNTYWNYYKRSVEAQFLDIGLGPSILYDGFCAAHGRLYKELERPYYRHPILLVISDGQLDDAEDADLDRIVGEIQQLGVQIVCCYVGPKTVIEAKRLYATEERAWPQGAERLFRCSSTVSDTNEIAEAIVEIAQEKSWQIPINAKLFFQINQSEMLEELTEILLSPLKD